MAEISHPKMSLQLNLDAALIEKATALGIDISEAAERGIAEIVRQADRLGAEARAEAEMKIWNDYIRRHGSVAEEFSEIR